MPHISHSVYRLKNDSNFTPFVYNWHSSLSGCLDSKLFEKESKGKNTLITVTTKYSIFSNSLWESVNFRNRGNATVFTDYTKCLRRVV